MGTEPFDGQVCQRLGKRCELAANQARQKIEFAPGRNSRAAGQKLFDQR